MRMQQLIQNKNSFEPDLNQRPMDIWQCTTTVHRSTNWAIEGEMGGCDQNSGLNMIGWQCPWQLNVSCYLTSVCWYTLSHLWTQLTEGDVAQMVERSLSMWEVGGSIPPVSKNFSLFFFGQMDKYSCILASTSCLVLWCSGYHICFTRRRSPVRSWAGSDFFLTTFLFAPTVIYQYFLEDAELLI